MKQIFTLNHSIYYFQEETPILEKRNEFLLNSSFIKAEIKEGQKLLPNVSFNPKPSTLNSILNYSKNNKIEI